MKVRFIHKIKHKVQIINFFQTSQDTSKAQLIKVRLGIMPVLASLCKLGKREDLFAIGNELIYFIFLLCAEYFNVL